MGLKVRWSEPALDELDEALGFIAFDHPEAAQKLWLKIRTATRSLPKYPRKGRVVPEYEDPDLRELIVGPFRVIYITGDLANIYILAVVRSERLLDSGIPERS